MWSIAGLGLLVLELGLLLVVEESFLLNQRRVMGVPSADWVVKSLLCTSGIWVAVDWIICRRLETLVRMVWMLLTELEALIQSVVLSGVSHLFVVWDCF